MTTSAQNQEIEERLCEATMAILQNIPDHTLNIVLVNKALFYADLFALRDYGYTITGTTYLGLAQGPVVAKYDKRVVGGLEKRGWAKQLTDGKRKPLVAEKTLTSFPHLSEDQLKILSDVGQSIAKHTSRTASLLSHDNLAWQKAHGRGLGAGRVPMKLNMILALQQLPIDDNAWLSAPTSDEELAAFARADAEDGEVWT